MKKNLIISGVGGQGILSISYVIVSSATKMGLNSKQSEVHGMSQRGGPVYSFLRISSSEIYSDLIPKGECDIIISLEPMEALRYINYLKPDGLLITDKTPFLIKGYDIDKVISKLKEFKNSILIDAKSVAKSAGSILAQNMVMVGSASNFLEIDKILLKESIKTLFSTKSQKIVDVNLKAFESGIKLTTGINRITTQ